MAFSAVFQFALGDEAGKGRWLLEHYLEHNQFTQALATQTITITSVSYPIQRMQDPERWLEAHQQISQNQWSAAGGGQSTDFGTLDWSDSDAVQDWMNLHALWHKSMRDTLGL